MDFCRSGSTKSKVVPGAAPTGLMPAPGARRWGPAVGDGSFAEPASG